MPTRVNYFEVLELGMDDIQTAADVNEAYEKLFRQSLGAGSRPRSDGTSQTDWRNLLKKARDVLLDPEQRRQHVEGLRTEEFRTKDPRPSLDFDKASALLGKGWGLVKQRDIKEAVDIAKRLPGDHREYTRFRTAIAELFITHPAEYPDAVEFLQWCMGEEPDNEMYRVLAGTALAKGGTFTWNRSRLARHLPRHLPATLPWKRHLPFATSTDQVASAERNLTLARELCSSVSGHYDDLDRAKADLDQAIADLEKHIGRAKRVRWNGDPLTVPLGFFSGVFLGDAGMVGIAALQWVSTVVYFALSPRDPQWKLDAEQLREDNRVQEWREEHQTNGQTSWRWSSNLMALRFERVLKASFTVLFLPFVAGWKVYRNFWPTYSNDPSEESTREGIAENVSLFVRGSLSLLAVVLTLMAVIFFVSYFSERSGGPEPGPEPTPPPQLEAEPVRPPQPEGDLGLSPQ